MIMDASIWDDYEDWREGQTRYETSDIPDYAEGWQWACCGKLSSEEGCVKGPHVGKEYVGLTFTTTRENRTGEALPEAKHQKIEALERIPSKAHEVVTVLDSSDNGEESEEEDSEGDMEPENVETCTACRKEYDGDDDVQNCLSHDGMPHLLTFIYGTDY